MKNEIPVDLGKLEFKVLPKLFDLGDQFYEEAEGLREETKKARARNTPGTEESARGKGGKGRNRKRTGMRVSDLW